MRCRRRSAALDERPSSSTWPSSQKSCRSTRFSMSHSAHKNRPPCSAEKARPLWPFPRATSAHGLAEISAIELPYGILHEVSTSRGLKVGWLALRARLVSFGCVKRNNACRATIPSVVRFRPRMLAAHSNPRLSRKATHSSQTHRRKSGLRTRCSSTGGRTPSQSSGQTAHRRQRRSERWVGTPTKRVAASAKRGWPISSDRAAWANA